MATTPAFRRIVRKFWQAEQPMKMLTAHDWRVLDANPGAIHDVLSTDLGHPPDGKTRMAWMQAWAEDRADREGTRRNPADRPKLTREGKPFRTDAARYLRKTYGLAAVRAHVTDAFKVKPGSTLEAVLFGLRQAANLTLKHAPIAADRLPSVVLLARYAREFDVAWKRAKTEAAALNAVAMAPVATTRKNPADARLAKELRRHGVTITKGRGRGRSVQIDVGGFMRGRDPNEAAPTRRRRR